MRVESQSQPYVPLASCPFCLSTSHEPTSILHYTKVGIAAWSSKVLECTDCGSQWTTPRPTRAEFDRLYRECYAAQHAGMLRWERSFPKTRFSPESVVLEIGGGTGGIDYEWAFMMRAGRAVAVIKRIERDDAIAL